MSDDLIEFLNARLDEDEELVETIRSGGFPAPTWTTEPAKGGGWEILREADDPTPLGYVTHGRREHVHIARHDPAREDREVTAKRRILTRYEYACRQAAVNVGAEQEAWEKIAGALERDVLDLASIHSDHPDYRKEWAD